MSSITSFLGETGLDKAASYDLFVAYCQGEGLIPPTPEQFDAVLNPEPAAAPAAQAVEALAQYLAHTKRPSYARYALWCQHAQRPKVVEKRFTATLAQATR